MLINHSVRRGLRSRIPHEADKVKSAVITFADGGTADIANKYNKDAKCFMLDFEDTENLNSGSLAITSTKDGVAQNNTIQLEVN